MQQNQNNKKEQKDDKPLGEQSHQKSDGNNFEKTKVKDAHASGSGSLGKSDENQIENLNPGEKKENVY